MDSRKVRIKYLYELPEYLHAYIKIDAEKTIYQIDLGGGVIIQAEKQFFIFINEEENENMAALTGYAAVAVIEQGYSKKEYYYAIYADGYNYKVGDKVLVSNNNDIWTIKRRCNSCR